MKIDEFARSTLCGRSYVLQKLYSFIDAWGTQQNVGIRGLLLLDIDEYRGTDLYDSIASPKNTLAFACTGGDDVHFSLVPVNGRYGDDSPVVMTVPMASGNPDETNFIVGETLHEFLCLGCVHGFFALENLAYNCESDVFDQYAKPPAMDRDDVYKAFRAELSLSPWPGVESRLEELDAKYFSLLELRTG